MLFFLESSYFFICGHLGSGAHLPDVPHSYTEARGRENNCTTRAQKQVPVATDMTLTGSDTA